VVMPGKHPEWLKRKAPDPAVLARMKTMLDGLSLFTVCESAQCPNQGECFAQGTVTFLILGDICTRNCRFCAVKKGHPLSLDPLEPQNVALAVKKLGLKHAVITSVTRDDLPDGGAGHFARTVKAIQQASPQTTIEVLIPDFQGSPDALKTVVASSPEIINHNVETISRLYSKVRPKASYNRSLNLLRAVKSISGKTLTKSGIMVGLGEKHDEVVTVMEDLRAAGCDSLTIGQYLPPSPNHYRLARYVTPPEFQEYQSLAEKMGFCSVASGPFVRSSFNAANLYQRMVTRSAA
jgi:lipoic acid synthetase